MSLRHPITGALSNPEWDAVRDRWNERHCNAVMAEARARSVRKTPTLYGAALKGLFCVGAVILVAWAVLARLPG